MRPTGSGSPSPFLFPRGRRLVPALLLFLLLLSARVFGLPAPPPPPPFRTSDAAGRGDVTLPVAEYRSLLEAAEGSSVFAPGARIENAPL